MTIRFSRLIASVSILLLTALSAPFNAIAQSAPQALWDVSESRNVTYADIGAAVLTRPNYLGSKKTINSLYPYVNAEYRGRLYMKPGLGGGIYAVNKDKFRINLGANYEFGRDAETISGFVADQIDSSFTANIGGRYITSFGAFEAQASVPVTGDLEGERLDLSYIVQFQPFKSLRLNPGLRASFWSEDRINQFYASAPTLKLPGGRFEGDGTQSVNVFMGAFWQLASDYEIAGLVEYSTLVGDLTDSALVEEDNGVTASIALARKF